MHRRQWDATLYGIAEDQSGYFTAAQAKAAGLHQVRLVQLFQQGDIERVTRGVYRFTRFFGVSSASSSRAHRPALVVDAPVAVSGRYERGRRGTVTGLASST
jgi:predicted transcriptional regulator of viral defense system